MPRRWRDQVREAFANAMARDAILLRLAEHGVRMMVEGDTVGALTDFERKHVLKAASDIRNARRRLIRLSERLTDEAE